MTKTKQTSCDGISTKSVGNIKKSLQLAGA